MKRIIGIILALWLCLTPFANAEYKLARIEQTGLEAGLSLYSISPDGSTLLCWDKENWQMLIVNKETGEKLAVWADYENSVEDIYDNLEILEALISQYLRGEQAINWSPDGRYIAVTNWRKSINELQRRNDVFVIDTETGALRDYQTYSNKFNDENMGTVIAARFSPDGKTLYFTLYNNRVAGNVSLCELDMETGKCAEIAVMGGETPEGDVACDLQDLQITPGGTLVAALNSSSKTASLGLKTMSKGVSGWQSVDKYLPKDSDAISEFQPSRVMISPTSGLGIMQLQALRTGCLISVFDSGADFAGYEKVISIPSIGTGNAERITIEEWVQHIKAPSGGMAFSLKLAGIAKVLRFAISPDGTRAILLVSYAPDEPFPMDEYALLMLDLQTLEYAPIQSDNLEEIPYKSPMHLTLESSARYNVIEWVSESIVLMNTSEGEYRMFELIEG